MAKRKRTEAPSNGASKTSDPVPKKSKASVNADKVPSQPPLRPVTIQIIAGSYDRVLHGMTATIDAKGHAEFADTFLFNAHTSAIRCLAISPPSAPAPGQTQKVLLASGSTDERINVYNISAHPPSRRDEKALASAGLPRPVLENPRNRELGTLLHHSSTVTRLLFPTRSKLLSASEDSTIGVTRTRDWTLLSTIRVPIPKVQGRPSGDTAPFGGSPAGVNDFAVDPSLKVMISVSKGERCMRLWNLVTGKKAGVLNFGRETLTEIGEGRHATGEGRRVVWGSSADGDEFCVGFDRDIVVYDMGAEPKCRVLGDLRTKVHQFCYFVPDDAAEETVMAVSTEDGRVLFFSTQDKDLVNAETGDSDKKALPTAKLLGQIGGKEEGVTSRIKDFAVITMDEGGFRQIFIVGGSSDGRVRIWRLDVRELRGGLKEKAPPQAGTLLGTYETQNRITCLVAFAMIPRPEGAEDSEEEEVEESENGEPDEDEDGEDDD